MPIFLKFQVFYFPFSANSAQLDPVLGQPAHPGLVPEKLPRKLKFDMQAPFNPTRTNIKRKLGSPANFVTIQTMHLTKQLLKQKFLDLMLYWIRCNNIMYSIMYFQKSAN